MMSTRPLGRISAGAAPFALASATALRLLQPTVPRNVHIVMRDGVNIMILQHLTALWLVASLLAVLALAAASARGPRRTCSRSSPEQRTGKALPMRD
jgi:hypothetical protein